MASYYAPTGIKSNQPRARLISVILIGDLSWPKSITNELKSLIPAGKHSPQWVYAAGAEKFHFHHHNGKPADYMPIPWHPVLQEKFGNLIKKLGERYDSSPYLSYVIMTGFGHSTEAWFAGPDDMDGIQCHRRQCEMA